MNGYTKEISFEIPSTYGKKATDIRSLWSEVVLADDLARKCLVRYFMSASDTPERMFGKAIWANPDAEKEILEVFDAFSKGESE
jgi:hypothetical protein